MSHIYTNVSQLLYLLDQKDMKHILALQSLHTNQHCNKNSKALLEKKFDAYCETDLYNLKFIYLTSSQKTWIASDVRDC